VPVGTVSSTSAVVPGGMVSLIGTSAPAVVLDLGMAAAEVSASGGRLVIHSP